MKTKHILVEFEKMISDGNYGRERAVVQFAADLDEDEDLQHAATLLLAQARNRLEEQLSCSESLAVRRAINPPPRLCRECNLSLTDEEDYYHPACEQALQNRRKRLEEEREARWKAEQQQQRPLVGVGASNVDDDDDTDDDTDDGTEENPF